MNTHKGMLLHTYIVEGIGVFTVDSDFKMTVVSVCLTGAADISDRLSLFYIVSHIYRTFVHMSVQCCDLSAVVYDDVNAVAVACVGCGDDLSRR